MFWLRVNMKRIWNRIKECLKDESGIGVVEIILILVVLIGLVIIFKAQLTELVQTIFSKITSESGKIQQKLPSRGRNLAGSDDCDDKPYDSHFDDVCRSHTGERFPPDVQKYPAG